MPSLISTLQILFARAFDEENGQGLTEYSLILALIALVAIITLMFMGGRVTSELIRVSSTI